MELTILRSILLGQLRPWLSKNQNTKFFSNNLTPQFLNPKRGIDEYYNLLKGIYNNDKELFKDDSLAIYLKQPASKIKQQIKEPLVLLPQLPPTNPIERFYYALIKNEVTRISNNVLQAIIKDIKDVDRKYIINSVKSNLVSFLSIIGDNQSIIVSQNKTSQNIMSVLQSNTIRLLLEIELLYPHYLSSIPSDKHQIYTEYLKTEVPTEDDYYKTIPLLNELSNLSTQVSNKIITQKLDIPDAFSFKFKGDVTKLKTTINQLTLKVDLIKDPTTEEQLFEVLTSKNLTEDSPLIYLDCETVVFKYFIDAIKIYFNNFTPTTMGKSKLFRSKDNPEKHLKAQTIYASKSNDYDDKKTNINNIINNMQ